MFQDCCRVFAKFYPSLANYHVTYREIKRQHFASMKSHKSTDPELRKKGVLQILEIGPGPGYNFEFYPPNSQLTAVEVNRLTSRSNSSRNRPTIRTSKWTVSSSASPRT